MNNEMEELKGKSIIDFIGIVLFFFFSIVFSEAGRKTGSNIGQVFGGMGSFLGIICGIRFSYNTTKYLRIYIHEQNKK